MRHSHINSDLVDHERQRIKILEITSSHFDLLSWAEANKNEIESTISEYGGILIRGADISSTSQFNRFVNSLYPNLLDYVYRSTPRTKLGGKIYTATEYPSDRQIPLHNEFSYARAWPERIVFSCMVAPKQGGETPIADCSRVYDHIDPHVIELFEKKSVLYERKYQAGIDLPWQEVFQTDIKQDVETFCQDNHIDYEWLEEPMELVTRQTCQATVKHPITGKNIWFNQAHLFHFSSLPKKDQEVLLKECGPDRLPRNSFYGDRTEISEDVLEHIRNAYGKEMIKFTWQYRDIMILDNVLMAHGREPFVGDRKIIVAMGT